MVLAVLVTACGGGGPSRGDQAVCEASLVMDEALVADVPDEELLLQGAEEADIASQDARDDTLVQLAEEAGIVAATARLAIEETGGFSDELFDDLVRAADDLSVECERLGL
jgi:hypothetical protein